MSIVNSNLYPNLIVSSTDILNGLVNKLTEPLQYTLIHHKCKKFNVEK